MDEESEIRQINQNYEEVFRNIDDSGEADMAEAVNHGMLVSSLAYRLSKELGSDEEACYMMSVAGMVHDIGKLKLTDYIYGRHKGGLMIEELRYIRTHPTLGYLALAEQNYPKTILLAVLHHHENYDGSGYPDNLAGEEIPYEARILRVCDVFAALVSNRLYRQAFSTDAAVELMIDEVKNFDMAMFLAFLRVIHSDEFAHIKVMIDMANAHPLQEPDGCLDVHPLDGVSGNH